MKLTRRALLTTGAGGAAGTGSVALARWGDSQPVGIIAASRRELAELPNSGSAFLAETDRQGLFVFHRSDLSSLVSADPRGAIYIPPTSDPTGISGAWVRERECDTVIPEWFGAVGDGMTDDSAAFVAMRTLCSALAVNEGSGLKGGPPVKLRRKDYFLASSFDWKGCTNRWMGEIAGVAHSANGRGSTIKMGSGATFVVNRSDTENSTTGTTISAFGGNGTIFEDITFMGPGQSSGSAASLFKARATHVCIRCRFIESGSHGCEIRATAGSGGSTEGNANNWLHIHCVYARNGKSGLAVGNTDGSGGAADVNAGQALSGNWKSNTEYGVDEASFLGNKYDGHFAGNTAGPFRVRGASSVCQFGHYIEGGQPPALLNKRSWYSGIGGSADKLTGGASIGAGENHLTVSRIRAETYDSTLTQFVRAEWGAPDITSRHRVHDWQANVFCSGSTGYTATFVDGTLVWGLGFAAADRIMAVNGNAGTRYQHGLEVAPTGALGLSALYLGTGSSPDGRRMITGAAPPQTEEHAVGEVVFNNRAAGPAGWRCVAGGNPGTWRPFGGGQVSTQPGTTYMAAHSDEGGYIRFISESGVTFIIPSDSSVLFPIGTSFEIEQAGIGSVRIVAQPSATINWRGPEPVLAGQYAVASIRKVASNTWTLSGDLMGR